MLTLIWRSRITDWSMTETVSADLARPADIAAQCEALQLDCEVRSGVEN